MFFSSFLLFLALVFSLIIAGEIVVTLYRCLNRYDVLLSSVIVRDRLITFYKLLRNLFDKLVDRFMLLASICSRHAKMHVCFIKLNAVAKHPRCRVGVECSIDSFMKF